MTNRITQYLDPYMATLSAIDNTDHPPCDCLAKAQFLALDAAQLRDEVWEREKEAERKESESENRLDAALIVEGLNKKSEDAARAFNRSTAKLVFLACVMFCACCVMFAAACHVWGQVWVLVKLLALIAGRLLL